MFSKQNQANWGGPTTTDTSKDLKLWHVKVNVSHVYTSKVWM